MIRYTIAKAMRKNLRSGAAVRIAIPLPHAFDGDLMQFVAPRLVRDEDMGIRKVERRNIPVNPLSNAAGLNGVLGEIIHGQAEMDDDDALVLSVDCVVVELFDRTAPQYGSVYPTRWPASVALMDGRTVP